MNRPEYVHCVKLESLIAEDKESWCGIDWGEPPFFQSVDHAVINGKREGRLVVCGECRREIVKALDNGFKYI